ncbi:hypothetical protein ACFFX0_12795 [Citricoccus parietis]|uniref:Uncharacterized protein n=1 Tax=Citricoccus parietis TaxID=592307 RepID=A0ABV5G048_9MICC
MLAGTSGTPPSGRPPGPASGRTCAVARASAHARSPPWTVWCTPCNRAPWTAPTRSGICWPMTSARPCDRPPPPSPWGSRPPPAI